MDMQVFGILTYIACKQEVAPLTRDCAFSACTSVLMTLSRKTVARMHEFIDQQGYSLDITDERHHHEIYLSDARKVAPEKLKTVIRHPIKKA